MRNQVKWETRKSLIIKEKNISRQVKSNPKAFYNYVSSKTKSRDGIPNLKNNDGNLTTNNSEKADLLNEYFSSVFTKEDLNNIPTLSSRTDQILNKVEITSIQMRDKLKSLKPSKSPGPDGIHPRVLRELADVIADPLKQIFDKSLSEGKLPSEWKDAEVRPIFKKGDKTAPGNYRPVSLTSVVCKVFESFIRDALYNHLVNNKLLSTEQFGFCKGRSCLTQLLATIYDWFLNLDNNIPVDAVYLDLRKAIDTVPHRRLLKKT